MVKTNARTRLPLLLCLLLIAFALRMVRVGDLRMWGDEAFSVYSAQRPLVNITLEGAENDPHPPLYYYLLHFYMPLAGASELAIRFFSVWPGVAALALTYATATRLFGPKVGLWAIGLGALAPFHIYYSQEIRMYALAIFLALLGSYIFVRIVQRERAPGGAGRGWWLAYAVTLLLSLYTLYHAAFVLLAHGICVFAMLGRQRELVRRWFIVAVVDTLLFLPWLALRLGGTVGHLEDRAGHNIQDLFTFVARGFAALTVGNTLARSDTLWLSLVFALLIGLALGVGLVRRTVTRDDFLILILAGVPIVAVYPLYLLFPILVTRLFALACLPLVIVIARSLDRLGRAVGTVTALVIVVISAYSLDDYYFRFDRYNAAAEDYVPAIRSVEEHAHAGDVVLFHADWQIGYFLSHYQGPPLEYRMLGRATDVQQAVGQARNVWAVVQDLPLHDSEIWLVQHAFPLGEQQFGKMRVSAFQAGVPARGEKLEPALLFDNGMELQGYHINDAPLESGRGLVTVQLDWRAQRDLAADYTVSVRLTSDQGRVVWAQEDNAPSTGTLPTSGWRAGQMVEDRHVLAIPAGTPPGVYDLQVILYQSDQGRAAQVLAPDNRRGESVSAGQIEITLPNLSVAVPGLPDASLGEWNAVRLVKIETSMDEVWPGQALPLVFYWRALDKPVQDYVATVRLVDASGAERGRASFHPANNTFRTSAWNAGQVWMDRMNLDVDAQTPSGEAELWVSLVGDSEAVSAKPAIGVAVARVSVRARTHSVLVPPIQNPVSADFGTRIKLLGYDVSATRLTTAEPLQVTLYWQARETMRERYTVFVHILNARGELVAQKDSEPQAGQAPTLSWLPGEVIPDRYEISLPSGLAPGEYQLEIGLYDANGKRLGTLQPAADHWPLGHVQIVAP